MKHKIMSKLYISGSVQKYSISIVLAMDIL